MRKFIGTVIFSYLMISFILYVILVSVKTFLDGEYLSLLIVPLFAIYAFFQGNK